MCRYNIKLTLVGGNKWSVLVQPVTIKNRSMEVLVRNLQRSGSYCYQLNIAINLCLNQLMCKVRTVPANLKNSPVSN